MNVINDDKGLDVTEINAEAWIQIRSHPVFHKITDDDLRSILPFFRQLVLPAHEFLIEEGHNASADLYIVMQGQLDVIKVADNAHGESQPWIDTKEFVIARLTAGDTIGELGFVKGVPRSATIRSTAESLLLGLDSNHLGRLETEYPKACGLMMKNILGYVAERLKQTSSNEVNALRIELQNSVLTSKANLFFSYIIGLLCVYNLAINTITNLSVDTNRASIISALIIVIFCAGLVFMIRQSKLPVWFFGLTTRNWKPAVKESLVWSAIIIAIMIAVKWLLITYVPKYNHLTVFSFDLAHQKYLAFNFALYGLHSPVQEFIARGVLQGSLQHFFRGRNVTFRAIIISNALFSATHVHLLGGMLGVIVFIPGLFWGWLYSRHGNLIGVSISHILVGWTALFFLNLESLF
jgi:CRP-like cAMP-binding protein/membrane protease YdiL (CAAX protease family)